MSDDAVSRICEIWTKITLVALVLFILTGCALTKGRIKGAGVTVNGQKDANGVSLASDKEVATITLPAGSKLTTVKWDAVPWQPAVNGRPEVAAQPAREETHVVLSRDAEWRRDETKIVADAGVIDTSVARYRIDVQSRQWLLYWAGILGLASIVARVYFKAWPTLSNGLMFAAIAAFGAWKLAEVPWWAWIAVLVVAGLLIVGYKRREKDEREEAVAPVVKSS